METDSDLVRRVVAGESAAYGELARRWFYRIVAFCRLSGHSFHDAEELAQDVLIRGYRCINHLDNPDGFGSWLRGIAKHVCADWGRSKRIECSDKIDLQSKSDVETPIHQFDIDENRIVVWRELEAIPEPLKDVVLLHYYEELTYDEIAKCLGVSRATVNERLAKARSLLRVRLAKLRSDV